MSTLVKDASQALTGNKGWKYNGVLFGGSEAEGGTDFHVMWPEVSFESAPAYTPNGRDVMGYEWTVTIRSYLIKNTSGGHGTEQQVRAKLYGKLQQPNKELYIEQGYGIIGPSGASADNQVTDWVIMHGVKPRRLSLKTLNGLAGVMFLEWSFTAMTYICENTLPHVNAFSSFWTQVGWNIQPSGLQSRSITGGYTVALNSDYRGIATADYMRGSISFDLPVGFRRVGNQWEESVDKSTMRFQIVDEQFQGTAYPVGIVAADGSFSIDSEGPAFATGSAQLNASFEVAPNYHITTAPYHFITALVATQAKIYEELESVDFGAAILTRVNLRRGLYDSARKWSGSATWQISGCVNSLFTSTDIWQPFVDPSWAAWDASTSISRRSRGTAGLAELAATDIPLNACDDPVAINYQDSSPTTYSPSASPYVLVCDDLEERNSWMVFDNKLRVFQHVPIVEHGKAVAPSYIPVEPTPTTPEEGDERTVIADDPPSYSPDKFHLIEANGYPKNIVIMSFVGVRMKFKPQLPILTTIDGKTALPYKRVVHLEKNGNYFGCPVSTIKATLWYKFEGTLTGIKPARQVNRCSASDSLSSEV